MASWPHLALSLSSFLLSFSISISIDPSERLALLQPADLPAHRPTANNIFFSLPTRLTSSYCVLSMSNPSTSIEGEPSCLARRIARGGELDLLLSRSKVQSEPH
ncbi:hypothetical protein GQ54DRAFT_56630 [Martensiomyces pterosporus]|nr:hypothetical protein GQ54DRAFT_56630 [Martensiomyces pterosporus]